MEEDNNAFYLIPAASLMFMNDADRQSHIKELFLIPKSLRQTATSEKTAYYLKSIIKKYDLTPPQSRALALLVFKTILKKMQLAQMSSRMSETGLKPAMAVQLAKEIEKDLFAPIAQDFNISTPSSTTNNLLDLKEADKNIPSPNTPL
ncbi:MAG: hypothetical protein WEC84_02515 [Candidatus Andersenbacteria bacterium]